MLTAGPPVPEAASAAPPLPPVPPTDAASVTFVAAPVVPDWATAVDAAPELALLRDSPMAVEPPVSPVGATAPGLAAVAGADLAWGSVDAGSVGGTELDVGLWATAAPPRKNNTAATRALRDALSRETVRTETQPAFICQSF
jgi:hypothetical protein